MHYRNLTLGERDDERMIVEASLSSEQPVFRPGMGNEILLHTPEAVDLKRSPLPLLTAHDLGNTPVGVVENMRIVGKKLRGSLRFGNSQRAQEMWADVKAGVLRSISIGYEILDGHQNGTDYLVSKWAPYEVSLVSVPADSTVGIGRSYRKDFDMEQHQENENQDQHMSRSQKRAVARTDTEKLERVQEILDIGEAYKANELARDFVRSGQSVEAFKAALLERMATKPLNTSDIGMTPKEAKQFSFVRAIRAQTDPEFARREAGFELEASRAVAQRLGREPQGVFIPVEVLRRDLNVGSATAGGNLVATNLLAENFIDMLRVRTLVLEMGATQLNGLVGNVAIPRQTSGNTAYWVTEGNAPTEGAPAFDQVTLSPKTVGAYTDFTRKLMLQGTPDIEQLVQRDLATVLGAEIDRVAIVGSGSAPEPRGILNTSGIGDVPGGTNGLAPTWAHIVQLEGLLGDSNADFGSLGYLTNSRVRTKLKTTEKSSSTAVYLWGSGERPLNDYRAGVSNNVPSNLTKGTSVGVCSAIILGNWSDLLIGQWGGLDLLVDPYTASAAGTVRVRVLQDVDIAVRNAQSFAAMKDALTA